jgi:hypothetical protein
MRFAREVCEARWPEVIEAAGLQDFREDEAPDDADRDAPVEAASRLAGAIEAVCGPAAPELLRRWGQQSTSFWIKKMQQLQEGSVTYLMPFRMMPRPEQKVEDVLYIFTRNQDRIRGERLTTWKQVDRHQFWLVHYDNLMAVGRRRPARSCYFWTAALETTLRWGGLANDWVVEEAECGCVTGAYDCVFTVKHSRL